MLLSRYRPLGGFVMFNFVIASSNRTILLIAILLGNTTYSFIENITEARDPQGEKTLVFVHDIHFEGLVEPVKHFLGVEGSEKLNAAVQEQNKIFQDKLLDIVSGKKQLYQKTVFITETFQGLFNEVIEKVLNPDKPSHFYEEDLLWLVPHTLFSYATKSGIDPDTKRSLLQNYLINGVCSDNSSVLHAQPTPKVSWIIGDRWRSLTDLYISGLIPRDWQKMKSFLETNEQLKPINIRYVKQYFVDLKNFLDHAHLDDKDSDNALAIINNVQENGKVADSDHFVKIYEYLAENGLISMQHELNFSIRKAVGKRFDAELLHYLEHLNEIDKDAASVVLLIGNAHARNVLDILGEKGYQIEKPLTTDDSQSIQEGLATVIANAEIVNKALQSSSWF